MNATHEQIEQAKQVLRNAGYYVDSLWQIADVKGKFECTDEQAQDVLEIAFSNDATYSQIWESIDDAAKELGLSEPPESEEN